MKTALRCWCTKRKLSRTAPIPIGRALKFRRGSCAIRIMHAQLSLPANIGKGTTSFIDIIALIFVFLEALTQLLSLAERLSPLKSFWDSSKYVTSLSKDKWFTILLFQNVYKKSCILFFFFFFVKQKEASWHSTLSICQV